MDTFQSSMNDIDLLRIRISLVFAIIFFIVATIYIFYNMNKNYITTVDCNITNIPNSLNKEQSLVYYVDNVKYNKTINGIYKSNSSDLIYKFPEGNCTLYYAKANPDNYSVNENPTMFSVKLSLILFIMIILGFYGYNYYKNLYASQ